MAIFQENDNNNQRLDWRILQNGWASLYWKEIYLNGDIEWFKKEKYSVIDFDCKAWNNHAEMHKQLREKLDFPAYYGENLDALNDCLSDIEIKNAGLVIVFRHLDNLDKDTREGLLDTFADNARRQLLFGNRLIILLQVDNPDFEISVAASPVIWNGAEWLISKRQ